MGNRPILFAFIVLRIVDLLYKESNQHFTISIRTEHNRTPNNRTAEHKNIKQ